MKKTKKTLNTSTIVAIISTIVAIIALLNSIFGYFITKERRITKIETTVDNLHQQQKQIESIFFEILTMLPEPTTNSKKAGAHIQQNSKGNNSPNIADVNGNVNIKANNHNYRTSSKFAINSEWKILVSNGKTISVKVLQNDGNNLTLKMPISTYTLPIDSIIIIDDQKRIIKRK